MLKNLYKFIFLVILIIVAPAIVLGQETEAGQKTEINFFYSLTCPHCTIEETFLEALKEDYSWIDIKSYEFSQNIELALEFYSQYNVPAKDQGYVPVTFVRDRYFVGFNDQIKEDVKNLILQNATDKPSSGEPKIAELPIIGKINIENISFPVFAALFGFFDGFNVCSLGALVLILGLVITLRSRRKILLFGGLFVLITATVYGIMIFLWHRIFVFVSPYLRNVEIVIGLLAVLGGWYLFREYLKSRKIGAVCKYNGIAGKLAGKMNSIFEKKSGIFVMIGAVLFFAAVITVVEFPCSALFPLLFSGMLAQSGVSFYASLLYIGVFIFFYMLDELIVLVVAAFTMEIWVASPKIMKWLNLAGALMLFIFGFYYLLWPVAKIWFNL